MQFIKLKTLIKFCSVKKAVNVEKLTELVAACRAYEKEMSSLKRDVEGATHEINRARSRITELKCQCDARPGSSNFRKLLLRAKTASPNFETEASSSGYQQVRRQLQFDSAYCSFHRCMKFETTSDVRIVDIKHCLLELLRIASHDYSGLLKSANAMLEDEVGRRRALTSL